jgi:hypothetical protein
MGVDSQVALQEIFKCPFNAYVADGSKADMTHT